MKKYLLVVWLFMVSTALSQISHTFTFNASDITTTTDNEKFTHVTGQGFNGSIEQVGAPELPVLIERFVLPSGSKVTGISVNNSGEILLDGNAHIYPTQPAVEFDSISEFVPIDSSIYNSNHPFPTETSILRNDAYTMGYHVVTVEICPFKYIPNRKKLYLYQNVELEIQYTIGDIQQTKKITLYRNELAEEVIRASVINPELFDSILPTASSILEASNSTDKLLMHWLPMGDVPDYLIITNEELRPVFQQLADYKIKRGIPALVVTTEQIYARFSGVDKAEKIRNYLKEARQNWGDGLFVLLGGDTEIIPGRIASYYYTNTKSPSDLYYSDVYNPNDPGYNWNKNGNSKFGEEIGDGLELGADNFIGRAPVKNSSEANTFLEKVIKYEKLEGVSQKSYVNNMLLIGAYFSYNSGSQTSNPGGQSWHYKLDNEEYLSAPQFKKHRLYDDPEGVIAYIDGEYVNITGDEELTDVNLLNRLSNGEENIGNFHLVSYYDHGSPYGMGSSNRMKGLSVYREDMDNLTNGDYLQIMYTTGCDPGKFTVDAWAEHYMNNPNGGGVGIIANSETVSAAHNGVNQTKALFESIYGEIEGHPNSYLLGVAFANARDAGSSPFAQRKKVLTLFGDPTLATWSAEAGDIALSAAPFISIDNSIDNTLTVDINTLNEDASITLYKYNEVTDYPDVFSKQIIKAGDTTAEFILNPDTSGELLVSATAKNHLPATTTVDILMPQPHLYVTGYNFVDENNNGIIEPGESIILSLDITNSGGTPISNIQTVLSTHSGLATINNEILNHFGTVNSGQTITMSGFSFTMDTAYEGEPIPDFVEFFANITGSGNYQHKDNFYIEQKGADLSLGTRIVTDGGQLITDDFPLNTSLNLDIVIHNIGNVETGELDAMLTSTSSEINITTAMSTYENIEINSERSNDESFVFKLDTAHSGALPFILTLTNEFGQEWEFEFDLNEVCPLEISGFDFTSTPDRIELEWNPVPGIGGYNIYRSDNEDGIYEKVNNFLVVGTSAFTDYDLTEETNYYYKVSVVSLSGQECSLDGLTAYLAWTTKKNMDGFPVANVSVREGYSSPIIYDVNNDGNREIFLNYRRGNHDKGLIMGLLHDGQELFDIDGDPETVSGFALTDITMKPNSAVGDLDNDGHAEVISIGRNNALNHGRLYVYKTIDEDNDGKPDSFWETDYIDIGHRTYRNPVLYDLDNDGYLDIIVADEGQQIHVFDHTGNIKPGWPVQVGSADWSEGELAVADLDGDGFGEIVFGVKDAGIEDQGGGIFIFNHDGTFYNNLTGPLITFAPAERADGGITIADINNDGELDILFITRLNQTGRIYALKTDGNYLDNWSGDLFTFSILGDSHILSRISVGDLNNDGQLEVVFGSYHDLYALNNEGIPLDGFPIKNIGNIRDKTPILADVDGDSDIEIIVNVTKGYDNFIKVYNLDGSINESWNIKSEYGNPFVGSPAVGDINNDGLNEIIISTTDGTIHAWETNGSSDRIEWGMHRSDSYNTGLYKGGCVGNVDLYIQDGPTDLGIEPNVFTEHMWNSIGIWIRNEDDNGLEHQNPIYKANNQPNYINVKVINRGCKASLGTETLTVNWAKASTNLAYPSNWDGTLFNSDNKVMGDYVTETPIILPIIQPGEEVIISIPWEVPNPDDYLTGIGSNEPWHFCLLATVLGDSDPLTHPYTENPNLMVRENNNQAWKNLTIIQLSNNNPIGGSVAVYNHTDIPKSYDLVFTVDRNDLSRSILDEAEVSFDMNSVLNDAWLAGKGQMSDNIVQRAPSVKNPFPYLITSDSAIIKNIILGPKERGIISLRFNMLTERDSKKQKFTYHLVQVDNITNEKIGGESYEIRKSERGKFKAKADDIIADRNEVIKLVADDIYEEAVYNWYDMEGNLIHTGKELTTIADIEKIYKLEVIADKDGYKDYEDVSVSLNPHKLKTIVPNPATSNVTVSYTLNEPSYAYLSVVGYIGNDTNVERNYILDPESSEYEIDLSNYSIGFYNIRLICDGVVIGNINLIKE